MKDGTPDGRQLKISVLRFNPQEPGSVPRMQTYELEEADGMTLFIALNEIREKQDPSLQFDFVCRAGICGSCGMLINGRPTLACRTLTKNLEPEISLAPLPVFELIADLSVNTGKWMRDMSERLDAWVHMQKEEVDLRRLEEKMEPELAEKIYELDRCIECGCCIVGLRHRAHARRFCRRDGIEQDRPLPSRSAGSTKRRRFLRIDRRRRWRFWLHVAPRLPRCLSEKLAALHADRLS